MCLSVYLGTSRPIELLNPAEGQLGAERSSWVPPPLQQREFVYFLGRKGQKPELECSCLFAEHVSWEESGPTISSDDLYPDDSLCPFEQLRALCAEATRNGGIATIVSDDSNGVQMQCTVDDYCTGLLPIELIRRGNLLFADVSGSIPWRAWHVVAAELR